MNHLEILKRSGPGWIRVQSPYDPNGVIAPELLRSEDSKVGNVHKDVQECSQGNPNQYCQRKIPIRVDEFFSQEI